MSDKEEQRPRAQEYAQRKNAVLGPELGSGAHGIVFATQSLREGEPWVMRSAIKSHQGEPGYRKERDVYLRLREHGVRSIRDCKVPQLIDFDDHLLVIEMTVVARPFVLDFAGAYLDWAPEFPEEVLADWRADKLEEFGPHWPKVQAILAELQSYGIFVLDANPGNISFGD